MHLLANCLASSEQRSCEDSIDGVKEDSPDAETGRFQLQMLRHPLSTMKDFCGSGWTRGGPEDTRGTELKPGGTCNSQLLDTAGVLEPLEDLRDVQAMFGLIPGVHKDVVNVNQYEAI